jgi:hypothetical protein
MAMGIVAAIALFAIFFVTRSVILRNTKSQRLSASQAAIAMFALYFAVPFVFEFGFHDGSNLAAAAIGGVALGFGAALTTYLFVSWWRDRPDVA